MQDLAAALFRFDACLSWEVVAFSLLLSFILSQAIAVVYGWTYQGLSYSRSFVQSLILGCMITTGVLLVVGNSLAVGFGLVGALSVVRFRTSMKEPRDMMFVFASLAVGVAVGVQVWFVALALTVGYALLACHLAWSEVGARREFNGLVRFQLETRPDLDLQVKRVLLRWCANFVLINLRQVCQGKALEHAYQVRLKDPEYEERLVLALQAIPSLRGITYLSQEANLEL